MPLAQALAPQVPVVRQASAQQKPPRQAPEGHWSPAVHACPAVPRAWHWPPLQAFPVAQSASTVHVVLQAVPPLLQT